MSLGDDIIGAESGGNPTARNPRSSAGGLGQFTDKTWLNTIRAHRPDLFQSYTPQQLIAMKTDGSPSGVSLQRSMVDALASDNSGFLKSHGLDATPGNVYLAHFAGPEGAASLLHADPSAPVSSVLSPAAVSANPFLRNMTVAQLQQWASGKVGGGAPAPATGGGSFNQFAQAQTAQPAMSSTPTGSAATPAQPTDQSAANPQNPVSPFAQVPQIIAGFQKQDEMPVPKAPDIHINFPVPPGLARAQLLARAMATMPIMGDRQV